MINYTQLKNHLLEESCVEVENSYCDPNPPLEATVWFRNPLLGELCQIPIQESYGTTMLCHIFCELKINPISEYEDDYYVYEGEKNHAAQVIADEIKNKK